MKINFRLLLAGVIMPVGIGATLFSPTSVSNSKPVESIVRPYIVEEISPTGEILHVYQGTSDLTNPFDIASDVGSGPFKEDRYSAFPDINMGIGSKIILYRAPNYRVIDGKKEHSYRSWARTVGELLAEQKIEVGDDDKINFAPSTELDLNMEVKIIRVALTNVKKTEPIEFKVTRKEDKNLDEGKTRVEQKGAAGVRTLTYLVRREDGVEVSRTLTLTEITAAPVEEIIIIGTKPVITGWCKYNEFVLDASIKNGLNPNRLCALMKKESNGNPGSVSGGGHLGLFQYTEGFWNDAAKKAGYAGASWSDSKAQIYVTAWAVTHGYAGRWPGTFK